MYLSEIFGAKVDRSTKCYPELAGEGIEFSWGQEKVYIDAQAHWKEGKESFCRLVKTAFLLKMGLERLAWLLTWFESCPDKLGIISLLISG